jgi:hypothetical protein
MIEGRIHFLLAWQLNSDVHRGNSGAPSVDALGNAPLWRNFLIHGKIAL